MANSGATKHSTLCAAHQLTSGRRPKENPSLQGVAEAVEALFPHKALPRKPVVVNPQGPITRVFFHVLKMPTGRQDLRRRPPEHFLYKIRLPTRIGRGWKYALTIYPVCDSGILKAEAYDIWRRWEDCLKLQDFLKTEYSNLVGQMDPGKLSDPWLKAPSDRRHAADVHVYLPRLSASKSPFKASPALIAQRETQFASFVTVLLGDGLPPALRRLRADRVVRDFFGQREDDYELAQRLPPSFVRSVPPSSVPGVHSGLHTDGVDRPTSLVDSRPPSSFMIPFFVLSETTSLHSADETIRDNESEVLDPALPSKQASVSWFKSPDSSHSLDTAQDVQTRSTLLRNRPLPQIPQMSRA